MIVGKSLPDGKYTLRVQISPQKPLEQKQRLAYPNVFSSEIEPIMAVTIASETALAPTPPTLPYRTFQIIPHTNVKNERVDQFADVIAGSFQQLFSRFRGWQLRDPDRIFHETVLTATSYETFITTNTEYFDTVQQHAQMIWKHVTLQEKNVHFPTAADGNLVAYDMKLKYPSFLSLRTDRRLQEIPLGEILEIARAMQDGDRCIIQFGFQAAESVWTKETERARRDFERRPPYEWRDRYYSQATEMKPSYFGYEFVLRILVVSDDYRRRQRIARGILLALKQLKQDNELVERKVPRYRLRRWIEDMAKRKLRSPLLFGEPSILTSPEIAHFVKLPQRSLQEQANIITTINSREVSIPTELTQNVPGVRLGWVTERGTKKLARIPLDAYEGVSQKSVYDALCTATFAQGMQGSGKSEGFGVNWAYDMVMAGFSSILIDTADGQVLRNFVNSLPVDYPEEKLHLLNLDNKAWPLALGWDCVYGRSFTGANEDEELAALEISEKITSRFIGFINSLSKTGEFTDRMKQYVISCMRAITTQHNWSFLDLELALTSPGYREELLTRKEVRNMPDVLRDLRQLQSKAAEGKDSSIIDPILSRLRILSSTQFMANLFYQEPKRDTTGKPMLNLRYIMDNPEGGYGHVVCILASHDAWQENQATILSFFEDKINFNAFSRIDTDQANRKPVLKWIDEPHKVIRAIEGKLAGTSVEFRKYRVKNLFTGHSIDQMGAAADALLDGGAQITSFKTKRLSELSRFAHAFAPYEDAKELYDSLPEKWRAINSVRLPSGKTCPAFIADMVPPPPFVKDRSHVWQQCAERYGRYWKDVRDTIHHKRTFYQLRDHEWKLAKDEAARTAKNRERKEKKEGA
ncbi:hypothetical protein [Aneurinibacillus aneurinilyticus]|uniref:Uncharacterized protein n=3 Tax=Aneurinibacillus aneurinilyticus TaxID=1391 RepID=U1WYH9_ANEAE|nr:hypothetical protein [Aneurinibacillus aneurinilyticus]ERI07298.1 hypothetical protein HMPREF0083_04631 [Aneurinibacillus aneurinilyticus ATCC 12856]MED0730414.1 hypothetical protein [Aneurinibacillus aneurinilyticus]MED0739146.1 hypothetical protein [Aneurinibacillus aneurinilyticus]